MQNLTFDKIQPLTSLNQLGEVKSANTDNFENSLFKNIFDNIVNEVKETGEDYTKQQYLLAIGEIDDPHTVSIAATKAQISVDLMIQLRNRAMESYNELMRINL